MSDLHATPVEQSAKKQGDEMEAALQEGEASKLGHQHFEQRADAVPPAADGGHSHSAAAHLDLGGKAHTKPQGNLRHGAEPGALREPPMVIHRVGKQHRD